MSTAGELVAPDVKTVQATLRAVYNVALAAIHAAEGEAVSMSERFDSARDAILGHGDFHGWAMLRPLAQSEERFGVVYRFVEPGDGPDTAVGGRVGGALVSTVFGGRSIQDGATADGVLIMQF